MMKRITVDARMINASGIGTVIQNILKRLVKLHLGWNFSLIGAEKDLVCHDFISQQNVDVILAEIPIYSIQEQIKIPQLIPRDSDLLWVPHYNIPVFWRGPMLVTIHDVFHLAMPQYVGGLHKRLYAQIMFSQVVRKAENVVCVSQFTKQELIKYMNIDHNKISVIYNGVDDFWKLPLKTVVPKFAGPYILYVGNIKPHKNLGQLIEAYQSIANYISQDLVIVGKKEGFITGDSKVAKLAARMSDRIHFTGYISNEELKNYYRYADLFVFPSLYEGFGLPPLEAMSAGCQNVLVSDIPVFHEIYGNSVSYYNTQDTSFLANSILSLVREPRYMSEHLKPLFDWDSCVSSYSDIISNCFT